MKPLLLAFCCLGLQPLAAAPSSNAPLIRLLAEAEAFGFSVPASPFSAPVPAFKTARFSAAAVDEHPWVIYERELLGRELSAEDSQFCLKRVAYYGGDAVVEIKKCTITRNYLLDIYEKGDIKDGKPLFPINCDVRYARTKAEAALLFAKLKALEKPKTP